MALAFPPGIDTLTDAALVKTSDGGAQDWLEYESVRVYTNAFIRQGDKILLGYKKRGFGKGLYNGFGGKVDVGETPAQAAVRELQEEAGITAPLVQRGTLFFLSSTSKEAAYIHIFYAEDFSNVVTESDEMRPQWFCIDGEGEQPGPSGERLSSIPFSNMWEDDSYWLPLMLSGRQIAGRVDFDSDGKLQKWWFAASPL